MGGNIINCRPTHPQITQHFVRSFRRLATGPERDQQTGDNRAVGLDLDPVLVVAEQVTATQQMLELPKKYFNLPITIPPKKGTFIRRLT